MDTTDDKCEGIVLTGKMRDNLKKSLKEKADVPDPERAVRVIEMEFLYFIGGLVKNFVKDLLK